MNPAITVITPVYNGSPTIRDCLASVNCQTVKVEHIIIDGNSTDDTLDIVRAHSPAARIVSEADKGIYDAMNKGIGIATGEIVGILNADDFYASPQVLAKVVRMFDDPDLDACYGDLLYVADDSPSGESSASFRTVRYWKSGAFNADKFYNGWMPPHPTFFVRRRIYERYGCFNCAIGTSADYELMLRFLLKHRIPASYIPEILVKMRTGGASNASIAGRLRANLMDRNAWRVNDLTPYPWTLTLKPLRKIFQYIHRPATVETGPAGWNPELNPEGNAGISFVAS
jgi:glycosyltransferase